jgi:hypothetical protein
MTRRPSARHLIDREITACVDFDAALADFVASGDPEELLRTAGMVTGSRIPLDAEHALVVAELTGWTAELLDYDDAGRAVRRWFALMDEDGARH